ncbi:MAG: nucleotidyltransferase domain-containing protein [bacterium]|nr:nucleotidyltransferase domain-containing protein [bacterium]
MFLSKLSKADAVRMLKDFIREELPEKEWYKNISPHVKAMILYGSTAKGLNRADSDVDMLIIIPLAIEEKYTKGEYVYLFREQEINIVLRSLERLRELAEKHDDSFQMEVFLESEILWEADSEVRDLVEKIRGGKR